jgi:hypothetical protein
MALSAEGIWLSLGTSRYWFLACMIAATILPFVVAAILVAQPPLAIGQLSAVFWIMAALSATHVASTAYILFNPADHAGVRAPQLTLVGIPLLLLVATFMVLLALPLWASMLFMLVYIHYGMWHFARQNLGVLSFVARISMARPIDKFERATIMLQVVAGMFAAYAVFAPALMLNPKVYPFDLSLVDPVFRRGW